ncbi:MAG: methyltransferase domain-containing protein [candidate division Zixibacteria bacterium]|nr:methyltransferase domain-containing protein [Candidatus Tariuqbacter arcticus]
MDKPQSNIGFKLMSIFFSSRYKPDFLERTLKEAGLQPGFCVLDYGCGPGGFSIAAAEMVGESGRVYALDIHPLAEKNVKKLAAKRKLANVETICSDCATGLESESIDVVLLYDILHGLSEKNKVLAELHRVMKPDALLSFSDHHLKKEKILAAVTENGLFKFTQKGELTYSFVKSG